MTISHEGCLDLPVWGHCVRPLECSMLDFMDPWSYPAQLFSWLGLTLAGEGPKILSELQDLWCPKRHSELCKTVLYFYLLTLGDSRAPITAILTFFKKCWQQPQVVCGSLKNAVPCSQKDYLALHISACSLLFSEASLFQILPIKARIVRTCDRAFLVVAPMVKNSLPRETCSAPSLLSFQKHLNIEPLKGASWFMLFCASIYWYLYSVLVV